MAVATRGALVREGMSTCVRESGLELGDYVSVRRPRVARATSGTHTSSSPGRGSRCCESERECVGGISFLVNLMKRACLCTPLLVNVEVTVSVHQPCVPASTPVSLLARMRMRMRQL